MEKEGYAIAETIRKLRHYILGVHFHLVTDQRLLAFMHNIHHREKVKNDKIQRGCIDLYCYSFDATYSRGENIVEDTHSRVYCVPTSDASERLPWIPISPWDGSLVTFRAIQKPISSRER